MVASENMRKDRNMFSQNFKCILMTEHLHFVSTCSMRRLFLPCVRIFEIVQLLLALVLEYDDYDKQDLSCKGCGR